MNNQKKILDKIIKKYKDKKGIIHCVTFELSNWLQEYYNDNKRFIFHTPETRDEALHKHMNSPEPTILVSPSMMEGINLIGELGRFQIILKIPFPNLGSNNIKKRKNDYPEWYPYDTCCTLIQAYGRSIRDFDDYCDTYILDDSFSNLLKFNYKYLPNWFTDAIKILKI